MDEKRVLVLLDRMTGYLQELKGHLPATLKEYKANIEKRRFCERTLQLLIEVCIDVGQFLLKEQKLGLPDDEEGLFEKLFSANIISEEMAAKLSDMKKFRNVLIHHYFKIDDALVFHHAQENLEDFIMFKMEILSFLRQNKVTTKK